MARTRKGQVLIHRGPVPVKRLGVKSTKDTSWQYSVIKVPVRRQAHLRTGSGHLRVLGVKASMSVTTPTLTPRPRQGKVCQDQIYHRTYFLFKQGEEGVIKWGIFLGEYAEEGKTGLSNPPNTR